jgi:hypothetical protein
VSPRVSRTRTLPAVEPILLTPRADPFDDAAWLFEPKYDGYRGRRWPQAHPGAKSKSRPIASLCRKNGPSCRKTGPSGARY